MNRPDLPRPPHVSVIIPALNEEQSIGRVLDDIPKNSAYAGPDVIVVDNGSTDATAEVAAQYGARVVHEPRRGYGSACLAGIAALGETDIVVFLDADYSDYPDEMPHLIAPIADNSDDLVIGSRMVRADARRALLPQARFGNRLATRLIRLLTGVRFTDLGPFRAIRRDALSELGMCDTNYGWTVEMQIKAAKRGMRCGEIPVRYRDRIGESKISGTVMGSVKAGWKILFTIGKYAK